MSTRWKHQAEYGLVRLLEKLANSLPRPAADSLGERVGALVHAPLGIRRNTVLSNLRAAFPDAGEAWVQRVARAAYQHLGREAAATLRLSSLDAAAVRACTRLVGWDQFKAGLEEGRGALLVTGHFGNWEMAAASIAARGVAIEALVKRQTNRRVDSRFESARRRLGVQTIDLDEAPRRVPRALRAGRVIGMVADQDAGQGGVSVPFFGRPVSAHRGPALFALRLGTPVFASAMHRLPGPELAYEGIMERVPVQRSGDLEDDVRRLTADLAARLEAAVRRVPEQYFWFHRRWKSTPAKELAPETTSTISL